MTKTKNGCSKCSGIILADTEDWDKPLCYSHWHQYKVDESYLRVTGIIDELIVITNSAVRLRDEMKEIISVDVFKEKRNR